MAADFITFLVTGAVAGWVASYLVRGRGFGILGNILVGMIGSILGGFAFKFLGIEPNSMAGSIAMAATGAAMLFAIIVFVRSR